MKKYSIIYCIMIFVSLGLISFSCGEKKIEPVILKVAINQGPEGDAIISLAKDYKSAKIEIIKLPYQALREQLILTLNDDRADFDVVMIDDPWFPQLADKLAPIKNVPAALLDDIVPASLNLSKFPYEKGELRALPFVGNTQLLFYRKDILSAMGILEIPKDWQSLAKMAIEITNKSEMVNGKKVYGYTIRGRSGAPIVTDFLPIYWSLGGQLVDDRGAPKKEHINKEKLMEALKIYKSLLNSSPPGSNNFDWSEMTAAFINGQSIFQLNWPAAISKIDSEIKTEKNSQAWGVALPPGNKNEDGTSMIGNWLLAIPSDSKSKELSEELIVWVMEQQGRVANSGNPPTRKSVFKLLSSKSGFEYFDIILAALERSTPRARTEQWSKIEDAISRSVSKFLVDNLSEEIAADMIISDINSLFN